MKAVVAGENDDRVFTEAEAVEFIEHAADLRVHIADAGEVAMQEVNLGLVDDLGRCSPPRSFAHGLFSASRLAQSSPLINYLPL